MTPHETALVATLLERLKKTDSPDKDSEAEALIRQTTAEQPDAAYHLVQTVLIQDLSLHVAQNRIAELEKSLAETNTVSFLPHSFLGGFATPREPAPMAAAPPRLNSPPTARTCSTFSASKRNSISSWTAFSTVSPRGGRKMRNAMRGWRHAA